MCARNRPHREIIIIIIIIIIIHPSSLRTIYYTSLMDIWPMCLCRRYLLYIHVYYIIVAYLSFPLHHEPMIPLTKIEFSCHTAHSKAKGPVLRCFALPFQYRTMHRKITSFQSNASVNDSVSVSIRIVCHLMVRRRRRRRQYRAQRIHCTHYHIQLLILASLACLHITASRHRDGMQEKKGGKTDEKVIKSCC